MDVQFRAHRAPPIVSDELRIFAFEAIRELLFNVAKHAGVKEAQIRVEPVGASKVKIKVMDQGPGFDPARNTGSTFGLLSIIARADAVGGHFEVGRGPQNGTCALLILPLR